MTDMTELPCPADVENGNCTYANYSYCSGLQFLNREEMIRAKRLGPLMDRIPPKDLDKLINSYCADECLIIMESLRLRANLGATTYILLDHAVEHIMEQRGLLR